MVFSETKETTVSKSSIGWLLIVLGGAGVAIFLIKVSIIGYYPGEFAPFAVLGFASAVTLWIGDRFRKAAAFEARANGDPDGE